MQEDASLSVVRRVSASSIHYKTTITAGRATRHGRAELAFKRVGDYLSAKPFPTDEIHAESLARGLSPEDLVGHIKMFYPNGDNPCPSHMRLGIGSRMLAELSADLLCRGGRILYALPTTCFMTAFLEKHGFTPGPVFGDQFFLTLC